ncbi:MAG: hypothetical protein ACM3KJ_04450, partial [Bacillota bacterium]
IGEPPCAIVLAELSITLAGRARGPHSDQAFDTSILHEYVRTVDVSFKRAAELDAGNVPASFGARLHRNRVNRTKQPASG